MNKEALNKRLKDLVDSINIQSKEVQQKKEEVQQIINNLILLDGARQEVLFWINELNKSAEEVAEHPRDTLVDDDNNAMHGTDIF